jgi:4-amino-4-deoxychorismate lyase
MPAEGALRDRGAAGLELIETMRFEPGRGIVRRDGHLSRMASSAIELGFPFPAARIADLLDGLDPVDGIQRVRLALDRDGGVSLQAAPFTPVEEGATWRVALARTTLDADDPLLRHKTTRRDVYAAARAEHDAGSIDEVLLCNGRGDVCEGTITNVFVQVDEADLLTPSIRCGLLPGVLRAELIASGRAREAVLTPRDLRSARTLMVGNSLRGLIPATLIEP